MEELYLQMSSWIDMVEFEMQFIEFQSSSIFKQKLIDLIVSFENIEERRLGKGVSESRGR